MQKGLQPISKIKLERETANLNMDRDGKKLWTLMKSLNGERKKTAPIVIKKGVQFVSGQAAANCFIDNYENVST